MAAFFVFKFTFFRVLRYRCTFVMRCSPIVSTAYANRARDRYSRRTKTAVYGRVIAYVIYE